MSEPRLGPGDLQVVNEQGNPVVLPEDAHYWPELLAILKQAEDAGTP